MKLIYLHDAKRIRGYKVTASFSAIIYMLDLIYNPTKRKLFNLFHGDNQERVVVFGWDNDLIRFKHISGEKTETFINFYFDHNHSGRIDIKRIDVTVVYEAPNN